MQRRSEYVGAGTIEEAPPQLRSDGELSPGHRAVHEQYAFSLFLQIAGFCACAIISGVLYVRWLRLDAGGKKQSWRLHGWFTALTCIGSFAGAVAWGARMQSLVFYFQGNSLGQSEGDLALRSSLFSDGFRYFTVHLVFYPIEFLCLSIAKLMMLDRLQHFAFAGGASMKRELVERVVLGAVILGNLTGLVANFVSAARVSVAGGVFTQSAEAFAANNTALGQSLYDNAFEKFEVSEDAAAYQNYAEMAVLLLIILAFVVVSILSTQLIKIGLRNLSNAKSSIVLVGVAGDQARQLVDDATAAGRQLMRKVVGTVAVVFVSLLLRAIYASMLAVADSLQDVGKGCSDNLCSQCFNVYALALPCSQRHCALLVCRYTHVRMFIVYSPALTLMVVLISSPLTLLVALWGMTGVRALELMAVKRQQLDSLKGEQTLNRKV